MSKRWISELPTLKSLERRLDEKDINAHCLSLYIPVTTVVNAVDMKLAKNETLLSDSCFYLLTPLPMVHYFVSCKNIEVYWRISYRLLTTVSEPHISTHHKLWINIGQLPAWNQCEPTLNPNTAYPNNEEDLGQERRIQEKDER